MDTRFKAVLAIGGCAAGIVALRQIARGSGASAGMTPAQTVTLMLAATVLVTPLVTRELRSW